MTKLTGQFLARSKRLALVCAGALQLAFAGQARAQQALSADSVGTSAVMVSGGPLFSKHLDNTHRDYTQRHSFAAVSFSSHGGGSWGVYTLTPNSLGKPSVGVTYMFRPHARDIKGLRAEAGFGGGFSTGYFWPVTPIVFAQGALVLHRSKNTEWLLSSLVMPYPAYREEITKEITPHSEITHIRGVFKSIGIVATTPALGFRYRF